MMRLFVQEIARQRGLNMSQLQRLASLPMGTMQRYWHGRGVGGKPLTSVDLRHLERLCTVLECEIGELLRREGEAAETSSHG